MLTKKEKEQLQEEYRKKSRWLDNDTLDRKIEHLQEKMEDEFWSDMDAKEYEKMIIFYEQLECEKEEREQRKLKSLQKKDGATTEL